MSKLIITILFFTLISCSTNLKEYEIVGKYEVDKFSYRDKSVLVDDYSTLSLNPDSTFEFQMYNKPKGLTGRWKIVQSKKETLIEFTCANKKMNGRLKGTIISFDYPNDPFNGRYNSILFVRLR
ncbi:hypothetical protein EZ428_21310 [Pedobacter frigiditerrae]|uniref:Lipoprotein n=1 Tax=Pedobacter frigiditerrae TaxID=2530452 RepID=A0A4R0MLG1_9SPHI|nr:hypothetical protein EZ428_21310 [Pedobacter frigiditerrae]